MDPFLHLPALNAKDDTMLAEDDEWLRCLDLSTTSAAGCTAAAAGGTATRRVPVPLPASRPCPIRGAGRPASEDPHSSWESTTTILGAEDDISLPDPSYRHPALLAAAGGGGYCAPAPYQAGGAGAIVYPPFEGACLPPPAHAAPALGGYGAQHALMRHQPLQQAQQQLSPLVDLDSLLDFQSSGTLSYIGDDLDAPAYYGSGAVLHPQARRPQPQPHWSAPAPYGQPARYEATHLCQPQPYAQQYGLQQDEWQAVPPQQEGEEQMEDSEHATEDSDATMHHAVHSPGSRSPASPYLSSADTAAAPSGAAAEAAAALLAQPQQRPALRRQGSKSGVNRSSPQVRLRLVVRQELPRVRPSAAAVAAAAAAAAGRRRPLRAAALRSLAGAGYAGAVFGEEDEEEEVAQQHGQHAQQAQHGYGAFAAHGDEEPAYKLGEGGEYEEEDEEEEEGGLASSGHRAAAAPAAPPQASAKKKHNPWSQQETEALIEGVRLVGIGKWAEIKKLPLPAVAGMLVNRSAVDLKDKWRNLSRVARLPKSALKSRLAKGGSDTPLELVLAVKELLDSSRADHREWR